MVYKMSEHNRNKAEALFDGWQETLIWSCLQNVMGHIYVNHSENPTAAMAILGDFSFFAGMPDKELIAYKPDWCSQDFMIMVPGNDEWAALIVECYQEKAKKVTRYAIKKEKDIFDNIYLQTVVDGLPDTYKVKMIDEQIFEQCKKISWCRDFVSQYDSYAFYQKYGLGAVILKGDEIVSGASSYSGYLGGIEIEIDTREDYRRRGLAFTAGAKLILECLNRDWYPSWDAQNKWSVALAEKLGYHYSHDYTAYEISGY